MKATTLLMDFLVDVQQRPLRCRNLELSTWYKIPVRPEVCCEPKATAREDVVPEEVFPT
jgi:hypothetical protein